MLPLLTILIAGVPPATAGATAATPDSFCSSPEARAFDFWIGEWVETSLAALLPDAFRLGDAWRGG